MESNPVRVCDLLVGLGDITVLGVDAVVDDPLWVYVETREPRPVCVGSGTAAVVKERSLGSECTVAGATEVPPGDHAFALTDVSDLDGVELLARKLVDGHTFQDALDLEKEAGGPGSPLPGGRPSWWADVMPDFDPPDIELADNQQLRAVSLEAGNHMFVIWATDLSGSYGIWLCGPLDVVEP